jgi:hypothetical protein
LRIAPGDVAIAAGGLIPLAAFLCSFGVVPLTLQFAQSIQNIEYKSGLGCADGPKVLQIEVFWLQSIHSMKVDHFAARLN